MLGDLQPNNTKRQDNVWVILAHLGEAQVRAKRRDDARVTYSEALALATKSAERDPKAYAEDVAHLRAQIDALTGPPTATRKKRRGR
jgi:hypothetical protein